MTVYIALLGFMCVTFIADHSSFHGADLEKRSNKLLRLVFIAIFLLCAFRASSVGRDIPGYEKIYNQSVNIAWDNYDYVYFESGYIFLMKICLAVGMNFQWFLAVSYLIMLLPVYFFIKTYSDEKIVSAFVFVCYMFFEFYLTGLRQAISMSIALIGFMVLLSGKKWRVLYYIGIIYLACLFHQGALICYLILPLLFIHNIIVFSSVIVAGCGVSLLLRNFIFSTIKEFFGKETFNLDAGLYIGLNFLFLILLAALFLTANIFGEKKTYGGGDPGWKKITNDPDDLLLKLFLVSIMIALFFGSELSARSYMFYNMSIVILLPNALKKLSGKIELVLFLGLIVFLMVFFIWNALSANNFDIVPYRFFWQANL